jgi:hypothetical protein
MLKIEGKDVKKCADCPLYSREDNSCIHEKSQNIELSESAYRGVPHWCPEVDEDDEFIYFDQIYEGKLEDLLELEAEPELDDEDEEEED